MVKLFQRAFVAFALAISATPLIAASASASNSIDGSSCSQWVRIIDVSSYQPNVNWISAKSDGVAGAWIKTTEGTWYTNPYFGNQKAGAASVGLPWGGYDFATPSDNAAQDATYFVQSGGASGTLAPVLDLEQSSGQSEPAVVAWATTWANTVRFLTGRQPLLYTGGYYPWTGDGNLASAFPLGAWIAAYPLGYTTPANNSACGLSPYPNAGAFNVWSAWQYTSVGQISGIAPTNVDISAITPYLWNVMTGSLAQPSSNGASNVLTIGSSGTAVIAVQNDLNFWNHAGLAVDGQYGPATASAVMNFQANVLGVPADGQWGPATQAAYVKFVAAMAAIAKAQADAAANAKAAADAASAAAAKAAAEKTAAAEAAAAAAKAKADAAAKAAADAAKAKADALAAEKKYVALTVHCKKIVIRPGSSGACVTLAQQLLVKRGYPMPIDGKFGKKTFLATINVQTLHHIKPVSGNIGIKTWRVLIP